MRSLKFIVIITQDGEEIFRSQPVDKGAVLGIIHSFSEILQSTQVTPEAYGINIRIVEVND